MNQAFALKGNICHSKDFNTLEIVKDGYLICEEGACQGIFTQLPAIYEGIAVKDYSGMMIIPGLTDLHVHAPQYTFAGLGMDLELIDWLNTHTFPAEAKYADPEYAKEAYQLFIDDLKKGATTRACIFATIHVEATNILMDLAEESGLITYIGKVNMDRNSPDELRESSAEESAKATLHWLEGMNGKYERVRPIITPRFIPSCTDELMKMLSEIAAKNRLPVQSHLDENLGEVAWVQELCPASVSYSDAYDQFNMFGGETPTIMAHCVHPTADEIDLMRRRNIYVAHCPGSNTNLSSGVAPVRTYINEGIQTGLGSDVAGGFTTSIFRAMSDAIGVSKLRWRLADDSLKPLTVEEAFYLGTRGGGSFFGKVGCFEKGFEFDAVVIDDRNLKTVRELGIKERLERIIYLSDERHIIDKYVAGKEIIR